MNNEKISDYNPLMINVKQKLFYQKINNISEQINNTLNRLLLEKKIKHGQTVAIGVGSRGISNLKEIVKSIVTNLKLKGLTPFIIPAMGSHGGATETGQLEILNNYSIKESEINAEIKPDLSVIQIGELNPEIPIYFSKEAVNADHIVVINRIKPHTKFSAQIESGICKMLTIGMGKDKGASVYHKASINHGFGIIEKAAEHIINKLPLLFAMAIVEDGYHNTAILEAIEPENIIINEKELLKKAYEMIASIPFDNIDILIIDYIGKDISGIGMDSNVTGRHRDIVGDFNNKPHVKRIFIRDLTDITKGNANGIGLADFTTTRCVKKIDLNKTYINALTALSPEKAAIPMHFDTDIKCLEACMNTNGLNYNDLNTKAKIVRIKNTSSLEIFQVSKALENQVLSNSNLQFIGNFQSLFLNDYEMISL